MSRVAVFALAFSLLAGCGYSSPYMAEAVSPQALVPPPGAATVVFLRPSGYAYSLGVTIMDLGGRFLGDAAAESQFAVALPAGRHVFVAWAENTAALQAELAPGRTYFVEVSPRMGAWSARMQLLAIKPGQPSWQKRDQWLRSTRQFVPNMAMGQAELDRRAADRAERLKRAQEILGEYKPDELSERTLTPGDGI